MTKLSRKTWSVWVRQICDELRDNAAGVGVSQAERTAFSEGAYHALRKIGSTLVLHERLESLEEMDRKAQTPDLVDVLKWAIKRVELANAEGDPILSAWLSTAREAIASAEGGAA